MSKGLEALHHPRIKSAKVDISSEGKHDIAYMFFDYTKQYTIIENELKEYEMEHTLRVRLENVNYELVREKQENEKKLKALEIIKNIGILKPYETSGGQCWLETMCDATKITKDNYDLLKEVLL